jgi:hypothetical protein
MSSAAVILAFKRPEAASKTGNSLSGLFKTLVRYNNPAKSRIAVFATLANQTALSSASQSA